MPLTIFSGRHEYCRLCNVKLYNRQEVAFTVREIPSVDHVATPKKSWKWICHDCVTMHHQEALDADNAFDSNGIAQNEEDPFEDDVWGKDILGEEGAGMHMGGSRVIDLGLKIVSFAMILLILYPRYTHAILDPLAFIFSNVFSLQFYQGLIR